MISHSALRLVLLSILSASILPTMTAAQSQDPESVTEAARRAREHKKAAAKPSKSFTNDDVKPAPAAEPVAAPDAPAGSTPEAIAKDAKDSKNPKGTKDLADLKAQVKQAQDDYELIQRARALQEDSYYSSPSYSRDETGKTKLENLIQQTKDKKQALDALKAKLDIMLKEHPDSAETPPPQP